MRAGFMTMVLLVALAGCDRTDQAAHDVSNASASIGQAANSLSDAADTFGNADNVADSLLDRAGRLADRTADRLDDAGDRASAAVDRAAPGLSSVLTDHWIGRWKGVEGMMLVIAKDPRKGDGHYILTNTWTLDDKGVFPAVADGRSIRFDRPDGQQVLTHGDGEDTGLKWLAHKQDCLIVQAGEGYCRD